MLAALYRNSWFDRAINSISLISISFPEFFVAYIPIVLLASPLVFKICPPLQGRAKMPASASASTAPLPAMTLTLVIVAHMMRMTRAAIINLLASPYIEMARLKGASRGRSSSGTPCPMPGRRSSPSSPSTSPISSSAWWSSRSCSSIPASAR